MNEKFLLQSSSVKENEKEKRYTYKKKERKINQWLIRMLLSQWKIDGKSVNKQMLNYVVESDSCLLLTYQLLLENTEDS